MCKELSEMTLDELWSIFPIILREYNENYLTWYENEKEELIKTFKKSIVRISHIGSTAVPGILSKPTVDILMEITNDYNISQITDQLQSMQWMMMNSSEKPFFNQVYNKGYTKYGFAEKVYHLHVRYAGDWNELYFRDYLIEHPAVAKEYEDIKKQLKLKYEHNRDAYTDGKGDFILKYSKLARREYSNRYTLDKINKMED